jgi:hypothetical protein
MDGCFHGIPQLAKVILILISFSYSAYVSYGVAATASTEFLYITMRSLGGKRVICDISFSYFCGIDPMPDHRPRPLGQDMNFFHFS